MESVEDITKSITEAMGHRLSSEVIEELSKYSGRRRQSLAVTKFHNMTPAFYAATINSTALITFLVERCPVPIGEPCLFHEEELTPFWAAVWNNNYEAAVKILFYGANIRTPNRFAASAFMKCLSEKNTDIVRFILKAGFKINIFTEDHQTPLMFATYDEHLTKLILAKDRDSLKCRDILGNTALHYAAWYQNEKVIKLLIAEGLCLLSKNYFGKTALTITEQRNRNRRQRSLLYFYKTAKQCAVPREMLFPEFPSPVSVTGCPHSGQVTCAQCTTLSSQVIHQICKDCPHLNTPGSGLHVYKLFSS